VPGEGIVRRARGLVGVRFRLQGRNVETGLDCVGLVAAAVGREGVRRDYRLRGSSLGELERELAAAGLRPATATGTGDVLAMQPGPEQLHLAIWTGCGIVHADAGLGRIVERPGPPPWPVIGIWRKEE